MKSSDKKSIALNNITELKSYQDKYKGKFLRNIRLYTYSMNVSLDEIKEGNVIGYWYLNDNSGNTSSLNENIIQSCVDALVSQLASKNTIPFFTTINGTFKEQQVVAQCQKFFDFYFSEEEVSKKITEMFRDACIFGLGSLYVDEVTKSITKVLPWQIMYRSSEDSYGKLTRVYFERKQYPTSLLPNYKGSNEYTTYGLYYDITNKIKATIIDGEIKVEDWDKENLPFLFMHYTNPIYGKDSNSVVDLLYGIQMKLDSLYERIDEASEKQAAQTFFVPKGSDIKVSQLNNKIGNIVSYSVAPNGGNPITVSTPPFIDPQYISLVEKLKQDAYELVGISRLSAQSQKPIGLDSGAALKTMANIESERFEVQYKEVINTYVNLAKLCILIFEGDVLPKDRYRDVVDWDLIREKYSQIKIQFSAMDFLSKDPSTRSEQIERLVQMGIIPQNRVAQFYSMPDSDAAYNFVNNELNAIQAVISDCILKDIYDVPFYINSTNLKQEIINTMLSLKAVENEQNAIDIDKLNTLYSKIVEIESQANSEAQNNNTSAEEMNFQKQLERDSLILDTKLAIENKWQQLGKQQELQNTKYFIQ